MIIYLLGGFEQAANSVVRSQRKNGKLGNGQLLIGCGFFQNITPPSLSRDRRIKMEQTNKVSWLRYLDKRGGENGINLTPAYEPSK